MLRLALIFLSSLLVISACRPVLAGSVPIQSPLPVASTSILIPVSPSVFPATPSPISSPLIPTLTPLPAISSSPSLTPSPAPSPTPTTLPITTLLFTGVIVPARCVQAALDANGNPNYPYEEVRQVISRADLAIGVFNATMSDQVVHTGCVKTYELVGSPANADALAWAGFKVISVATNHIKDCGLMKSWCDETFFDTLGNLRRVGILPVGAGKDLAQSLQPMVVTVNGIRFGFVSLGDSKLNEIVFATSSNPGIALLTEENMRTAIAAARKVSDIVIALPHWGSEDIAVPNAIQIAQARYTVAAGADLVVGNHTHVVQGIQEINGVPVFYGLGNFVFDQNWSDHRQGVILLVKFEGRRYVGYELIPTHVDQDGRVHIAGPQEAAEVLDRIQQVSDAIH